MRRIYIAGHAGMVGNAILRRIERRRERGEDIAVVAARSSQLDLTDQQATRDFFENHDIDEVIVAAAKVGGIHANNSMPGEFIYDNLIIQCNLVHQAFQAGIKRLLFLGSSCIYPKNASQPIDEQALLTGVLEATNEPYAIAKIAGIKLCESYNRQYGVDYRSVMPTNLYGPGDNFHPVNSHVLPALIRRFHEAAQDGSPSVTIWGSGKPRREFLHVDDMAEAALFVHELNQDIYQANTQPMLSHVNVGMGQDISILELAQMIGSITGFTGEIRTDPTKPDGTMRKLLNVDRLASMGWKASINLHDGITQTYRWFLENRSSARV